MTEASSGSTSRPLIAVLDYGIGNLHSAQKAIEHSGADARLTADPSLIADADGVVLPGVGAFGASMAALRKTGLEQSALDAAASGKPFLGICIGMQMLFTSSEENPGQSGLGIIPGVVRWIPTTPGGGPKIPQMQWNRLNILGPDPLFDGLTTADRPTPPATTRTTDGPWVYFVHSLHGVPDDPGDVAATVEYGTTLNAAFRRGNVCAVQFHPEKSSRPGLALLANFARICASETVGS